MSTLLGLKGPKQKLIQCTKLIMELSKKGHACNFKIEEAEKGRYMLEASLSYVSKPHLNVDKEI